MIREEIVSVRDKVSGLRRCNHPKAACTPPKDLWGIYEAEKAVLLNSKSATVVVSHFINP